MRKATYILKRDDGSRVELTVEILISAYNHNAIVYNVDAAWSAPGKRKFTRISVTDRFDYRRLPFGSKERADMEFAEILKYATADEIHQCKLQLWESIKPTI